MTFLEAVRAAALGIVGDKGPAMPAILGVIVYCFFYPLPRSEEHTSELQSQ